MVAADASASTDPDATGVASYTFDFGDGAVVGPQAGATAQHTYPAAGSYTLTNGRYKNGVAVSGSDDLGPHVGHTVRLTGNWSGDKKTFNETKVDMVSANCSTGGGASKKGASAKGGSSSDTASSGGAASGGSSSASSGSSKKSKKSGASAPPQQ